MSIYKKYYLKCQIKCSLNIKYSSTYKDNVMTVNIWLCEVMTYME